MKQRFYHGGAQVYDELRPGTGLDGEGIYLTSDKNRALMYGARDVRGVNRAPHVTEVLVDTARAKVWDDDAQADLRDFTDAKWLGNQIRQYGEKSAVMSGQNVRVYLGWSATQDPTNQNLKRLGYQAISRGSDLIVLDPSIIVYDKPKPKATKRVYEDVGHTAEGTWGRAGSGMIFLAGPRMLLLLRSGWVMEPGTWGIPGGAIPVDQHGRHMAPLASAKREVKEEIGGLPKHRVVEKFVFRKGDFTYTTFIAHVAREFVPTLNEEHDDYRWWNPDQEPAPRPLHPGVKALLDSRGSWEPVR